MDDDVALAITLLQHGDALAHDPSHGPKDAQPLYTRALTMLSNFTAYHGLNTEAVCGQKNGLKS